MWHPNYIMPEVLIDTVNGHCFIADTWSSAAASPLTRAIQQILTPDRKCTPPCTTSLSMPSHPKTPWQSIHWMMTIDIHPPLEAGWNLMMTCTRGCTLPYSTTTLSITVTTLGCRPALVNGVGGDMDGDRDGNNNPNMNTEASSPTTPLCHAMVMS
jgi:hypothetical protein